MTMTDPLSITLAAVTLVTALKDIVELGDKIRDSFSKVPDNLKKSKKLALEISETLHELKEFCEENNDILERNPTMKKALVNLQIKLQEVYDHCAHLIPPSSNKYIGRLKVAMYLWRNGGRIEAKISELWKEVDNCYTKSTMFASMQTEAQTHHILNTSLRTEAQSHTILSAVLSLGVSDRNMQSFHTPRITISRPPSNMDENMAADMHLKVLVHKVGQMLTKCSIDFTISNIKQQNILSISLGPKCYIIDDTYIYNRPSLYQHAVQQSFLMQDLVQNSSVSSILQDGIDYLEGLGLQLLALEMPEEAAHISSWMVRLCRILASQDPQKYTHYLIDSLYSLSASHSAANNIEAAYDAIEECVALSQKDQNPSSSIETRLMHATVLTRLYHVVQNMGNSEQSSLIIQQAIKTYEDAFDINSRLDGISDNSNLSPTWWACSSLHAEIYMYALALHDLARHLQQQGSIPDAFNAERKALSILHNIVILNPDSSADIDIGLILYNLVQKNFRHMMSAHQSLLYAEQCIAIFQKYADLNPIDFGEDLSYAIQEKASILWNMGKKEAACASITEAAELAPRLVNDEGFITKIKEKAKWYVEAMSHHSI